MQEVVSVMQGLAEPAAFQCDEHSLRHASGRVEKCMNCPGDLTELIEKRIIDSTESLIESSDICE